MTTELRAAPPGSVIASPSGLGSSRFEAGEGLDISVLGAVPEAGEREALVDGIQARVLTTTQVLCGKLSRPEQLLRRDAYDLRHAGKVDRQSLAEAINGVERRNAENIISTWNRLSERWCAMAHNELRDIVPKHSYEPATLPTETAEALRDALYERVRIRTHGREGRFEGETAGGTTVEVAFTRRTLEKTFSEHGITDYLRAQSMGDDPDEILKRVKSTCRLGTRPQTPYERTHETPSLETPRPATHEPAKGGWPVRPTIRIGPAIKKTPGRKLDGPSGR